MATEYNPIDGSSPYGRDLYRDRPQEDPSVYEPISLEMEQERNELLRTLGITD